jgi:oligopeptide/dipeptide ABC transporter ATP-binding protein
MRQRAMIAMALSCRPRILIADEPTTALDVTIQAQILELMKELQQEYRMALVLITHDLGVIADIANRIVVMFLGRVVEQADADDLFYHPRHPYTQVLKSIPTGTVQGAERSRRLQTIEGVVPDSFTLPEGCAFADRCPYVQERCREQIPELETIAGGHSAACHFARELELAGVGES